MTITRRRRHLAAFAFVCACAAAGRDARASDSGDRAEGLFQQARELMGRGEFTTACPMLEESYALDHGAGTLLALALCHEGSGKTATALREYHEALAAALKAERPDRVMLAESHVQKLEALVPRVQLRPPSPEPAGLVLTLDGAPVDRAAMVAGAPVDPGKHAVVARVPGADPWTTTVDVGASSTPIAVDIPPFALPRAPEAQAPLAPTPSGHRTLGWIAGGAGVAAVAAGAVFGLQAFDAAKRSEQQCQGTTCTPGGVELNHEARRDALVSDVGFAVGGAALVVGLYLLLRAPSPPSPPHLTVGSGPGLGLGASW